MGIIGGFARGYRQEKKRQKLGELGEQYLGGDTSILPEIIAQDPQRAIQLQQIEQFQSQKQKQDLTRGSQLAKTILEADPEQRPEVYRASLEVAKKYGIDVGELPEFYSPEADKYLQNVIRVSEGMAGDPRMFGKVPEGYVVDPKTEEARRLKGLPTEEKERKIIKDVQGRQRYADTKELVFPSVKDKPKEYSGADAKTLGITKSGMEDIVSMRNLIEEVGGGITTGTAMGELPFVGGIAGKFSKPKEKQLRTLRSDLSDKIGRLRSGGAINKDEEYRFKNLLPTLRDDAETIKFKLDKIEREFKTVQSGITGEKIKPQITPEQALEELKRRGKL
jgi:hypothetical protein